MYVVVGCSECSALWIVEGRPETTECRRCGRRHEFDALRRLAEAEERAGARAARTRLLADRSDGSTDASGLQVTDQDAMDDVVTDAEYLEAKGLDPDAVARSADRGSDASDRERVEEAIRSLADPDRDDVVAYVSTRGVDESEARRLLDRLERAGDLTERDGTLRLL